MDEQKPAPDPLIIGDVLITPGFRVGNYVFVKEIGSGGMARVLLAKDPVGHLVALKVLRKSRFKNGMLRFKREFKVLSHIHHPNVIRVDDYGDLFGHPFIAMEYVDGPDLHSQIRSFRSWDETLRWKRVEAILVDLCRALAAVHRRGLVHRDLKPSNILINQDGVCKLTDFGIVKDLDPSSDAQVSTTLVGTWAYASPEQITGQAIDHRSDLYSLGVILFAMLTGKRPFVAKDMGGYLQLHRDRPAPTPQDVNPQIPSHLDEICRRLLQKSARDRYQSAQEILYRLEAEERVPDSLSRTPGWTPPLVGRDLECEVIGNAVSALTDRRGQVLMLEGEDGSGRSRLLEVASERARVLGLPVFRIESSTSQTVLAPTLALGMALAQELVHKTPSELKVALELFSADTTARLDSRYALHDGLREGFLRLLEERPSVILVDDLHDLIGRDLEVFAYLIRTLLAREQQPLLVVATLRPKANALVDAFASGEGLGIEPYTLQIGPLHRQDLVEVVADLLGAGPTTRALAERLHQETEGNAFFVTEFLRSMLAQGRIVASEIPGRYQLDLSLDEIGTGHLDIPPGIRQMLRRRLDALRLQDRDVLEVLAVAGREGETDLDVLLDVLEGDEDEILDAIDHLLIAGIVRERHQGEREYYMVSHRKFTDVVYRDLHPERRATLHRRIAGALELHQGNNITAFDVIGAHYRNAGEAGRSFRYLVAAARRLIDRSLVQEAWDLTETAAAIEETAAQDMSRPEFRTYRCDLLDIRADVLYSRGEWNEADRTWNAVLQLAEEDGDRRLACETRLHLAVVARRRGDNDESRYLAEVALEESRRLHFREGVADALHCLAALAWVSGNLDECERMANEGLLVAQGSQLADRRAELLLALTAAQATRGHLAAATAGLTEAEGIFREIKRKRPRCLALANIAELLTWQGEPLQARQRAHVAVQLATELEYKLGRTASIRAMATAAFDLGRYAEAEEGLLEALKMAEEMQMSEEMLSCIVPLVHLYVELGRFEEARRHGVHAISVAATVDPERYLPLLQAHLVRAVAADPTQAGPLLHAAESVVNSMPIPRRCQTQLALANANLAVGRRSEAKALAKTVVLTAGSRGFKLIGLEARILLTHLSAGPERRTHFLAAQESAKEFMGALPSEFSFSFSQRPFLRYLQESIDG